MSHPPPDVPDITIPTAEALAIYKNMSTGCLPDGMGVFHEAVYAKIPQSLLRERLSAAYFFEVVVTRHQEGALGNGGKLGGELVDRCTSCPPRRGLVSDPLRMDRRYRQWAASKGTEGLESLMMPWEQHDAGVDTVEVKLRPLPLPTLAMRRNHVVFNVHNSRGDPITCVLGGTLHPECEVPRDLRSENLKDEMPFAYATPMYECWHHSPAPVNIRVGCTVGYHSPSCPGKVYLLIQEPLPSGVFEDRLVCMDATFGAFRMDLTATWTEVFRSSTLQATSTEPTRPFYPTERFLTVDRVDGRDRVHVTQITPNGVAVYEWSAAGGAPSMEAAEWKLIGQVTNQNPPQLSSAHCGVAGSPVYDCNNVLSKIRIFAQCLGEDELSFVPRTSKTQGGFMPRLGNVLRATAAGSDPFFEVCPLSRMKLEVEPLTPSPTTADHDYSILHAPRDVEAALVLQDEIYDRPPEESASSYTSSSSAAGSWAYSIQNSTDQLTSCPESTTKSVSMGERMFSGSRSDSQPMDAFYQLVEEVDTRSAPLYKARAIQKQLMATARGIMEVASATGAPLHICAGMNSEQFQQRVIQPMKRFLRSMNRGGYSFDDLDTPDSLTQKQRPSHTRGVNANFVQPSDLAHRWVITVREPIASTGGGAARPRVDNSSGGDVLMLGIANKEESRERGMLAARCPDATNSNSLKSIAAQWITSM